MECWPFRACDAPFEAPVFSVSGKAVFCSTGAITGEAMARGKKEFYCPGGGAHCPVPQGLEGTLWSL